ncbi:TolC family outer membrane protein [Pontivivens insulae]|uniref:Protein CyaE n=1 Tax=Pontivivens insulae TaxID=1639689 RepID=A0A2R8AA42_9RHOB|nr:TolC family outer membrane protein [Pontivivens insulae]RED12991.1 outer membrane protein [Pontivivens insulae]SPF29084.1 Outer membrane efflux protein BepC [Pontivivens insulae]
MRALKGHLKTTLSAIALTIGLGGAASAETLTDTLVMAYNNSPALDVARAALRAIDEGVPQARSGLRPNLSASASATLTTSNDRFFAGSRDIGDQESLGISGSWTIFDGGATDASVNAALANVNAQRAQLLASEQTVLLDAVTAYLDVRRDLRFVSLGANNVRVINRQLDAAEDRFEVGEVTRTDVAQARARLAAARSSLVANQGALDRSREAYLAAVGVAPSDLAPPPPLPELPESQAAAEAMAMSTHPLLATRQAQVRAAEYAVDRARAAFRPSVALNGGATLGNTFDSRQGQGQVSTRQTQVGASVSLPLYRGGALSSAVRQAVAQQEQAQASLQDAGRQIRQSVGLAWANLRVARASITSSRQQITAARVAFEGIVEEARLGARTTLDVLDTEQELLNAQSSLVAAQRDEAVAAYSLLSAMGLLTVDHLGLPVDQYDPAAYFDAVEDGPFARDRQEVLNRILGRY